MNATVSHTVAFPSATMESVKPSPACAGSRSREQHALQLGTRLSGLGESMLDRLDFVGEWVAGKLIKECHGKHTVLGYSSRKTWWRIGELYSYPVIKGFVSKASRCKIIEMT